MTNTRSLLLISLAFTAYLLWLAWEKDYAAKPIAADTPAAIAAAIAPVSGDDLPTAEFPSSADLPASSANIDSPKAQIQSVAPSLIVETDVLAITISAAGGTVTNVALRDYRVSKEKDAASVILMSEDPNHYFVAQSGWVSSAKNAPDHRAVYQLPSGSQKLRAGQDQIEIPLTWDSGDGVLITKTFTLTRGSYEVKVSHQITNNSAANWQASLYRQLQRTQPPGRGGFGITDPGSFSFVGAGWYSPAEKFEKRGFSDFKDEPLNIEITGGWSAMIQHYFLAAWLPEAEQKNQYSTAIVSDGTPRYLIRQVAPITQVAAGQTALTNDRLYLGPKLQDTIGEVAPGLEYTVDYGIFTIFAQPLFIAMSWLHDWLGNWGWAIVALTILIKLIFYKLSEAQYRSMAKMRKMQPRMQALKERYGDDREKLNQAMLEFYKKEKINPLGGCLPMLIPFPIFIALYWVLAESIELRHAPWFGWIQSLSDADPYFILPIINAAAMIATQRLTPMTGMDPMQAKMMQAMPLVFSVMFAFFPAGLVLYWSVNGVLGLVQQIIITRRIDRGEPS